MQSFLGGVIYSHPTHGTHAIRNVVAGPWNAAGAHTGRFGYPTSDRLTMGGGVGNYYRFQNGLGAHTPDMGAWLDFTGTASEGWATASVTLYQEAGLSGNSLSLSLSSPSPVALQPQLGALNNGTSSVAVAMPTRTSLFLFDASPPGGRSVRISGGAVVLVSNIGAYMNERTSSLLFVNHGTASARIPAADLRQTIQDAIDAMDTNALMAAALAGEDASGSLEWNGDVTLSLLPGRRLVRISRRAFMDLDAACGPGGAFTCNADGDVRFTVSLRPYVDGEFGVRVEVQQGEAVSLNCSGEACGARAAVLAGLFAGTSAVRSAIESTFDETLSAKFASLPTLASVCNGISVKRIHVLPAYASGEPDPLVEVVVADTAAAGQCAASFAGDELSTELPAARVQNSNGTLVTTGVTVFPLPIEIPLPSGGGA
jgi:LGFP repeat